MPEKLKDTPIFKSEDEEREFWAKKDSTDFIDWKKSEVIVLLHLRSTIKKPLYRNPS